MSRLKQLTPKLNVHLDVLAASFMVNILSLTVPIVMLHVYDRILGNHSVSTALLLFFAAFVFVVIDGSLRFLRSLVLQIYSEPYALDAPIDLANKLMSSDKSYSPVQIRKYFDQINVLKNNYSGQSIVALLDLPFVFLYLYVLWFLAGDVAIIPGVLFCLAIVTSVGLAVYAKKLSHNKEINENSIKFRLYEYFFHLDSKKSHNLGSLEEAKLNQNLSRHIDQTTLQACLQSHLSSVIQVLSQLSTISVISFGAYKVIQGELTTGALAACSILAGRCVAPVGALLNTGVRLQENSIAKDTLAQLDQENTGINYAVKSLQINQQQCKQELYLVDTIKDLNIEFDQREVFDKDYVLLNTHSPLFSGTIIENLTAFQEINASEALDYAGQLGLHEYFNKLNKGYQTKVNNDRFDFYDTSTKIQIALIRALIANKKFILIQNILGSFDPSTRYRLIRFLHALQGHCIIVCDPLMLSKEDFLAEEKKRAQALEAQKAALMAAMAGQNA